MLKRIPVMNKLGQFICLAFFLLFPALSTAQDFEEVSLDAFIEQLNEQCPCSSGEDWNITKVVAASDTVLVEMTIPSILNGFISMLTVDNENCKRLWIEHLLQFGTDWTQLVERVAQEGRRLLLAFVPLGGNQPSYLSCSPDELGTILAKD